MRDYELMYIVRPTVGDEEFPAATERVDGIIANQAALGQAPPGIPYRQA